MPGHLKQEIHGNETAVLQYFVQDIHVSPAKLSGWKPGICYMHTNVPVSCICNMAFCSKGLGPATEKVTHLL